MGISPSISIITSVYNVEQFLPKCIKSIIDQTFKEWELILVNDGSTDNSGNICDEYANQDQRIKVVHKANSGQSDSRNIALALTKAPYIGYVDGDDWIEKDMYEILYGLITEHDADISICGYYFEYVDRTVPIIIDKDLKIQKRDEALSLILGNKEIKSFLWDKLYKKELLIEPLPISYYYEDYSTILKWFNNAKKIVSCNLPKYHYIQRATSTCNDLDPKKSYHFVLAEAERYDYLVANDLLPEQRPYYAYKAFKTGIRQAKLIAQHSSPSIAIKYIALISERLNDFDFIEFKKISPYYYIRRELMRYSPACFYYITRFFCKLKVWRKKKRGYY